jgi:hypothetical protein
MSSRRGIAWALVLCVLLAAAGRTFADTAADQRAIEHILDLFERAHLEEDLELLASLLSDNGYTFVMPKQADPSYALVLGKAELLQAYARRFQQVDEREHRHINRRIEVNGFVARSSSTIVEVTAGGERRQSQVHHFYAREEAGWKVVFSSTLLPGE